MVLDVFMTSNFPMPDKAQQSLQKQNNVRLTERNQTQFDTTGCKKVLTRRPQPSFDKFLVL